MKKYSPPPKNRRVLIYNIQSPRLSRFSSSSSNIRLQRSKFKLHNDSKDCSKEVDVIYSENKNDGDHVHVLNALSHNDNSEKTSCDNNQQNGGNKSDNRLNGANINNDDYDSDDDDDFDNGMRNILLLILFLLHNHLFYLL